VEVTGMSIHHGKRWLILILWIFFLWGTLKGEEEKERVCPSLSPKTEERIETAAKLVASELPFGEREKEVKDGITFFEEWVKNAPLDVEGYVGLARMLALHWRLDETQAKLEQADEAFDLATMKFSQNPLPYCYWASFLSSEEIGEYLVRSEALDKRTEMWKKAEWAYLQALGFPAFQPSVTFFRSFLHTLALQVEVLGELDHISIGYHWFKAATNLFPETPPADLYEKVFQNYAQREPEFWSHRDDATLTYEKGMVVYRNNRFRYEVRFPAGWVIQKEELHRKSTPPFKAESVMVLELPIVRQRAWRWESAIHPSISLTALEMSNPLPLKSFSEKRSRLTKPFRGSTIPSPLPDTYAETFLSKEGNVMYKGDTVYLVKGNTGYQIIFTATPDSYKERRLLFLSFLQSLKLL